MFIVLWLYIYTICLGWLDMLSTKSLVLYLFSQKEQIFFHLTSFYDNREPLTLNIVVKTLWLWMSVGTFEYLFNFCVFLAFIYVTIMDSWLVAPIVFLITIDVTLVYEVIYNIVRPVCAPTLFLMFFLCNSSKFLLLVECVHVLGPIFICVFS